MDGWGLGKVKSSDAIQHAKVPFVSSLYKKYPNTTLITCGEDVGLPEGQMGNSEVGHLNLGAGRIVYQELQRINVSIRNHEFQQNPVLLKSIEYALANNKTLHLIGLLSDGGVHSHINHLKAILTACAEHKLTNVLVHAFTDGRDTDPRSGLRYIEELQGHMKLTTGNIASITGRYYAMDRDKRWERVKIAYDAMVHGTGVHADDLPGAVMASYDENITDEFIRPVINIAISKTKIEPGDAVLCFNFRTDRCREITEALTQQAFPEQIMKPLELHYTTMTEYDQRFKNVHVIFETDDLKNTLGEILEKYNKSQLRIAETEKYPHVSFFFSGGRERPFIGEERIMIQSPKVATYDLQPEMSAYEVTEAVTNYINTKQAEINEYNEKNNINRQVLLNGLNQTNLGIFRHYVTTYLTTNPAINLGMDLMVRQLEPTDRGVPVQLYAFTINKKWADYEAVMADIFDHLLASVEYFELEVFEQPAGSDMRIIAKGID